MKCKMTTIFALCVVISTVCTACSAPNNENGIQETTVTTVEETTITENTTTSTETVEETTEETTEAVEKPTKSGTLCTMDYLKTADTHLYDAILRDSFLDNYNADGCTARSSEYDEMWVRVDEIDGAYTYALSDHLPIDTVLWGTMFDKILEDSSFYTWLDTVTAEPVEKGVASWGLYDVSDVDGNYVDFPSSYEGTLIYTIRCDYSGSDLDVRFDRYFATFEVDGTECTLSSTTTDAN